MVTSYYASVSAGISLLSARLAVKDIGGRVGVSAPGKAAHPTWNGGDHQMGNQQEAGGEERE